MVGKKSARSVLHTELNTASYPLDRGILMDAKRTQAHMHPQNKQISRPAIIGQPNFVEDILHIIKKIRKYHWLNQKKLQPIFPISASLTVYHSSVRSHLNYGDTILD